MRGKYPLLIGLMLCFMNVPQHSIYSHGLWKPSHSSESKKVSAFDREAPLLISFEPTKVFISPSLDEGETIMFHLKMRNMAPFKIIIKKLFIRFLKGEEILAEREQGDSFFRHGLIERKRKIMAHSSIKWSGVCLRADSFGDMEQLELLFHLKGRRRYQTIQVLTIPVERYQQKTKLRLPFRGFWKVTQGHACDTNHRLSGYGGDFAWDFAALGHEGRMTMEAYAHKKANKYVYGFGKEVLSPADGRVIEIVNNVPDNEAGGDFPRKSIIDEIENPLWAFGNFIIIDHQNGEYSLLAHLKKGSIMVKKGDKVQAGEIIARCGNSGNTQFPHLHYQLMNGDFPFKYEVSGLPALFYNYRMIKYPFMYAQSWEEEEREHIKIEMVDIIMGDPIKNSIIYAPN